MGSTNRPQQPKIKQALPGNAEQPVIAKPCSEMTDDFRGHLLQQGYPSDTNNDEGEDFFASVVSFSGGAVHAAFSGWTASQPMRLSATCPEVSISSTCPACHARDAPASSDAGAPAARLREATSVKAVRSSSMALSMYQPLSVLVSVASVAVIRASVRLLTAWSRSAMLGKATGVTVGFPSRDAFTGKGSLGPADVR
ncbi:hypothetical protein HMPREF9592_01946 [Cutibacterium acnes HL046PA1]|nr:hypothetical protein HMPREF9592_01946 [Cutibacterium acnes HL046PA1]